MPRPVRRLAPARAPQVRQPPRVVLRGAIVVLLAERWTKAYASKPGSGRSDCCFGREASLRQSMNGGTMLTSRPGNKGRRYPADPPRVEEIVAVMKQAGDSTYGRRLRGLIVVLWRAGLRISEALALTEGDLETSRGAVLVRRGKGGRRREVGMDDWAW